MTALGRLSHALWKGVWHRWPRPSEIGGEDGYQDFAGRIPLLATSLRLLAAKGPHGAVWWRYGHSEWETLDVALADPDDRDAYRQRGSRPQPRSGDPRTMGCRGPS
ncbi:hypothetical protein GCM10010358_75640 [Streptomyces minutiscleroticus]|uniref:Uncharacterized protein n=1 Tax=Streptomyces minutiscleroticus TaxID=68238 RepID=A0A918P1E6_9ACTN|nr:hypothetical protein [Streptomyces minutiscleroticus]GGY12073.1 hypothetical protein GCM10010358_75640 [Streptomyces minutiscleroticus]